MRALLSWSSGKDSAYALDVARRGGTVAIEGLLTTLTRAYGRVSMHGVREQLLDDQAVAAGLPSIKIAIPTPCSNEDYEAEMARALVAARDRGITHVIYGDLFLADLRAYREAQLAKLGLAGMFPLWGLNTRALADEMIAAGMSARLTCIDPRRMPANLAGRVFDAGLLGELPADVDPCGENGEFHTFVTDGPMFAHPIAVTVGEVVERDGFVFADLMARGETRRRATADGPP